MFQKFHIHRNNRPLHSPLIKKNNSWIVFKRINRSQAQVTQAVLLVTQEVEIRRIMVQSHPGKYSMRSYLEKPNTKQGWWSGSSGRVPA
jgi:hypothetical protein